MTNALHCIARSVALAVPYWHIMAALLYAGQALRHEPRSDLSSIDMCLVRAIDQLIPSGMNRQEDFQTPPQR